MTASCARGGAIASPLHGLAAVLFLIALMAPAAADEPIVVHLDQATIIGLPARAKTIVIGNPLIADISLVHSKDQDLAVVTGKGYGATNVIAMDGSGVELLKKTIEVTGPSDKTIVVYRGPTRQTYSCTPDCSPRITLGDTGKNDFDQPTQLYNDFFASTLKQAGDRNTQAAAAGAMSAGH
jgi:hypothetical protein